MIRLRAACAELVFDRAEYALEDLQAAALVVGSRGRASFGKTARAFAVELSVSRRDALKAVAAEFAAEALAQAYRRRVLELTGDSAAREFSSALTRGFAVLPPDPLEQLEPQVAEDRAREREKLLHRARELR